MSRRHPRGWNPQWRVVFALVPAVIAAAGLQAIGDPPAGSSRLESTRGLSRLLPDVPAIESFPSPAPDADEAMATPAPGRAAAGDIEAANASAGATVAATATGPAAAAEEPGPIADAEDAGNPAPPIGSNPNTAAPAPAARSTTTTRPAQVATTTTSAAPRGGPVRSSAVEAQVVPLTNADRSAEGLAALSRNGCLDGVASGYAEQMARSGVIAHNPGAGSAITGCRPGAAWGDNVGYAVPCSASVLEERWIVSPPHRRNILSSAFRHIGVGAWTDESGTCWVQVLFSS